MPEIKLEFTINGGTPELTDIMQRLLGAFVPEPVPVPPLVGLPADAYTDVPEALEQEPAWTWEAFQEAQLRVTPPQVPADTLEWVGPCPEPRPVMVEFPFSADVQEQPLPVQVVRPTAIGRPRMPAKAKEPPLPPAGTVKADFNQVEIWAAERGVRFLVWDDLPQVNARRERLGLKRFERSYTKRGR